MGKTKGQNIRKKEINKGKKKKGKGKYKGN
jgi:hypothetical protein